MEDKEIWESFQNKIEDDRRSHEWKAGTELDVTVAEKVMGQKWQGGNSIPNYQNFEHWIWPPPYSTNIEAAWKVVEHLRNTVPNWNVNVYTADNLVTREKWLVEINDTDIDSISSGVAYTKTNKEYRAFGSTTPEAICRVALLSVIPRTTKEIDW